MRIVKYKKRTNGIYDVFLETEKICLYEEVILKYDLLLTKEIRNEDRESIEKDNLSYEVYHIALKSLQGKYRSTYDLCEFLKRKEYPISFIEDAILKLSEQGYLNDRNYTKSYIGSQIHTTNHGPSKIKKHLLEEGIDKTIVEEEMAVFDEDVQREKIMKYIEKCIKTNRKKVGAILKNKIINDLILEGYDVYLIQGIVCQYDFSVDQDIVKKEYEKLYKRYAGKYQGQQLEFVIRQKLFQKGFGSYYEEV